MERPRPTSLPPEPAHEVLKRALQGPGIKAAAADIGVSESLLYKWTEDPAGADASGMVSPLARLAQILTAVPDADLANWICRHAGGFYVPNPPPPEGPSPILQSIRTMVREFSELLDTVTESIENDGKIDEKEARRIRSSWENLKRHMEQFSLACESGRYQKGR